MTTYTIHVDEIRPWTPEVEEENKRLSEYLNSRQSWQDFADAEAVQRYKDSLKK